MPEFHLLWTALPRRIDGNELVIDAFVSPRLGINEPAGSTLTLADFPTLTDWPSQIKDHLTFEVEFSSATPAVAATRVPLTAAESNVDLDQATWAALFPPRPTSRPGHCAASARDRSTPTRSARSSTTSPTRTKRRPPAGPTRPQTTSSTSLSPTQAT